MMGVGLGLKNIQTWIWDGLSPCLVILVSLLTVNIGLGIDFSVRLTVRWGGGRGGGGRRGRTAPQH